MKLNAIIAILLVMLCAVFAQADGIKPYPGTVQTVEKVNPPLIPPIVTQAVVAIIGVIIFLVMFTIFIIFVLFILKLIFGNKPIPAAEMIRREKIADAKGWNGSDLNLVETEGSGSVQGNIQGYCSGFKAEGEWDYITYHSGLPGYLFILKMLKGPRFQVHIPILDIMIPADHIIQLKPTDHTPPGRRLKIFASGIMNAHSGYEMPNTTSVPISVRMEHEREDVVARTHGDTASLLPKLGELYWEAKEEHFKKRNSEPSKSPAGR